MDHVLAAVLAVYAKWVRSDGNSGLLLWMYVSDTVTGTAGDSWQWHRSWPQHWWTLLGWSYLTLVWHASRDCEGLEMLPKCAFSLSDQCHFLYRNAHENPSGLCFFPRVPDEALFVCICAHVYIIWLWKPIAFTSGVGFLFYLFIFDSFPSYSLRQDLSIELGVWI